MWKLKIKPAFTLIEVICSIAIFSLLFTSALTIELNAIRLRRYNCKLYQHSILMETVKNNLIGNSSYDELKSLYNNNKFYINKEFLSNNKLKALKIVDVTSEALASNELYVKLNITDGAVIKVNIEFHGYINNKENIINTAIYKGNYQ